MSTKVLPTTHIVKLKDRREVAERTIAVLLEKPANFVFNAGQFAELFLVNSDEAVDDEQGLAFSMASAPEEDTLMFATRLRGGDFKRALETMPIGAPIKIEGPFGKFVLDDSARPAVFITGGIGITPVRSILVHAAKQQIERDLFLFYSNRRPEDASFIEELQALEKESTHFHFFPVMTEMEKSTVTWSGMTGHLEFSKISNYTRDYFQPLFYVSGSPRFVKTFRELLLSNAVMKQDIHSEDFAGY
ncbi:MAG: FAD-dependent oxidoreductase [Cyanobacteria bacterium SZAS LIN-3]|nr:FAD-dependent oxidoreductase [Cyanobacteria bacterium SZAS LIN-3]MBS2010326.1 FAD-dependent oxidoreductase [Cyanobacteria bacterium SZAS TMP-1]